MADQLAGCRTDRDGRILEADEFCCVTCGVVSKEHPKDGMTECPDCVEADERA